MNEDHVERETVGRWLRRYAVRILLAILLVSSLYVAIGIGVAYQTYHRERRIARKLEDAGCRAVWGYTGPRWAFRWVARWEIYFRIIYVDTVTAKVDPKMMASIQSLPNVHTIELHAAAATDDDLKYLSGLTGLKFIEISDNPITDQGLKHLANLTKVEVLLMNYTLITDDALAILKNLNPKLLRVAGTQVTDKGLEHLMHMTNLEELYVGQTKVTPAGRAKLEKVLTKCKIGPALPDRAVE